MLSRGETVRGVLEWIEEAQVDHNDPSVSMTGGAFLALLFEKISRAGYKSFRASK